MADMRGHDLATPKLRAAIFSRESKGKSASIETQEQANLAACDEIGAEVVANLGDRVSASRFGTKARAGWPEIIELVGSGQIDVLVVWEVSRADRTMDRWVPFLTACRDHGVSIYITNEETLYDVRKGPHRKALLDAGSDAELESEKISARTRRGVAGAAAAGKGHGPVSYGFTRIYDMHDRRIFTQQPNEFAPIAAEIIERVARRDPLTRLEREFNERGIPSPNGGRWTRRGLRALALNASYAGFRSHNGVLHEANWDGIVPVETWRAAVAVLNEEDRVTSAPGGYKWLLSYVATCPEGDPLQCRPPRPGGRRAFYRCDHVGIGVFELDEFITRLTVARLAKPDARQLFEGDSAEAQRARDEVARIRLELDDLAEKLAAGQISAMLAAAAEPGIQRRLAAAEAQVQVHSQHGAVLALIGSAGASEKEIRARWDALSVAGRRSVLDALFEEIKVGPTTRKLSRHASDEEKVEVAADRTSWEWA